MCGIFAIVHHPDAAALTALGLHALQHRGQESTGIAMRVGDEVVVQRHMGLVADVFDHAQLLSVQAQSAIGHVRYSTSGASHLRNAQPLHVDTAAQTLAIAHNGNLTNAQALRQQLAQRGSLFTSSTDTEVILHLLAHQTGATLGERMAAVMPALQGAYAVAIYDGETVAVARDPYGWRPLVLGSLASEAGTAWLAASETAALQACDATIVREVEPGEVVELRASGCTRVHLASPLPPRRACIFEHVYFARPDSVVFGRGVYHLRKRLGQQLALEHPIHADAVIPVPDSGVPAALGYAQQAQLPYEIGLLRSHEQGRTFLQPSPSLREAGVRRKLSPVREVIAGKSLIVVDDSLVRGTTARQIVRELRDHGAREVHLRIASPPVRWPCWYGIDTPSRTQLIAATEEPEAIARWLGADSLGYLSLAGLADVAGADGWCAACFDGAYPIQPPPIGSADTRRGGDFAGSDP